MPWAVILQRPNRRARSRATRASSTKPCSKAVLFLVLRILTHPLLKLKRPASSAAPSSAAMGWPASSSNSSASRTSSSAISSAGWLTMGMVLSTPMVLVGIGPCRRRATAPGNPQVHDAAERPDRRLIEASGPLPVDEYMALCLFDPQDGYYTTREPFGSPATSSPRPRSARCSANWSASGCSRPGSARPADPAPLVEIGPGRGTLMKDMLRTLRQLDPPLLGAPLHLVETSPGLTAVQRNAAGAEAAFAGTRPSGPCRERRCSSSATNCSTPCRSASSSAPADVARTLVGLDEDGALIPRRRRPVDPALLPPDAAEAPEGAIVEIAPARTALMAADRRADGQAWRRRAVHRLRPCRAGVGDTLQALRRQTTKMCWPIPAKPT